MIPSKIVRCVLTDITALISVLIISLVVNQLWDIPTAIILIQLLAIEVLSQLYPISTLQHDKKKHKAKPLKHIRIEIVAFGVWAAVVAYGSYLLFFGYHVLSPVFIDTSSSLYAQATTVTFVTLALCQALNIFFMRGDQHAHLGTEFLWKNKKLLQSLGVSFFLILNVVYNPLFHTLLSTASLGIVEWVGAIFCAGIYVGGRRLQRYTNLHTRHSLIKLHQELHR